MWKINKQTPSDWVSVLSRCFLSFLRCTPRPHIEVAYSSASLSRYKLCFLLQYGWWICDLDMWSWRTSSAIQRWDLTFSFDVIYSRHYDNTTKVRALYHQTRFESSKSPSGAFAPTTLFFWRTLAITKWREHHQGKGLVITKHVSNLASLLPVLLLPQH